VDLHIPDQIISDAIDFLPAMRAACNLFILWMISSMESQAVHLVGLDSWKFKNWKLRAAIHDVFAQISGQDDCKGA
jgi:hypothetical protein